MSAFGSGVTEVTGSVVDAPYLWGCVDAGMVLPMITVSMPVIVGRSSARVPILSYPGVRGGLVRAGGG